MSCYSADGEITSVRADFLVELGIRTAMLLGCLQVTAANARRSCESGHYSRAPPPALSCLEGAC